MNRRHTAFNCIFNHSSKKQTHEREVEKPSSHFCSFTLASVSSILVSVVIVTSSLMRFKSALRQNTQHVGGGKSSGYYFLDKMTKVPFEPTNAKATARRVGTITESSSPEAAVATVLSRPSQLSAQISHLDARDIVECYVVTRMAQLEDVASHAGSNINVEGVHRMLGESKSFAFTSAREESTLSSSVADATSIPSRPIMIRKSALAFRHRPHVASASSTDPASSTSPGDENEHLKYFELTLEYGPLRSGVVNAAESMPALHMGVDSNITRKYVTWDNKSRLYHSTRISNEWTEAYYMAQISGVVLEKIIQRAVEYVHSHPRYQPLEVVSIPSSDLILKSCGADDFVWSMVRVLAEFYVDIDPLLLPPRHRIQFFVADTEDNDYGGVGQSDSWKNTVSDEKLTANVEEVKGSIEGDRVAAFYENFFSCVSAIKTGNYSSPTLLSSIAPSIETAIEKSAGIGVAEGSNVLRDQNETAVVEVVSNFSSSSHVPGKSRYTSALVKAVDDTTDVMKSKSEALLSGDGFSMTSALSTCFSDPKYGIRIKDDMERAITSAYLYVDGDIFFRLNLTAPYVGIATSWETVPSPQIRPQGRGDAIDWAILALILMGALSGIMIMVYQWEKSPLKVKKGGGFPHSAIFLTTESIPSSMGGEGRSKISCVSYCDQVELTSPKKKGGLDGLNKKRKLSNLNIRGSTPNQTNRKSEYAKLDHLPSSLKMEMETATDVIERLSTRSNTKVSLSKQQVKFDESYDPQMDFSIDDGMVIV